MDGLNNSKVIKELCDDTSSDDSDEDPDYIALQLSNDSGV